MYNHQLERFSTGHLTRNYFALTGDLFALTGNSRELCQRARLGAPNATTKTTRAKANAVMLRPYHAFAAIFRTAAQTALPAAMVAILVPEGGDYRRRR